MASTPDYSVVIPFHNEEGAIPGLLQELRSVMDALRCSYEVILVNDGSKDETAAVLATATANWSSCRVISLDQNQGQAAALLHGFAQVQAPWIITLDGDGQNSPADIPRLIAAAATCDMVVGIRAARRDSWLRRAMSRLANAVRGRFLGDKLQDAGCALKLFRKEICRTFWAVRSLYSFMPAFAVAAGYRVTEIPVDHRERRTGFSNYGLGTFAWRPLLDMIALGWLLRCRRAFHRQSMPTAAGKKSRPV